MWETSIAGILSDNLLGSFTVASACRYRGHKQPGLVKIVLNMALNP